MPQTTIEDLERQQQELVDKFFDKEKQTWKAATPEEVALLQVTYRKLKNDIRFFKEELAFDDKDTPEELRKQLFPLVARRKWERNKTPLFDALFSSVEYHVPPNDRNPILDGDLFCFEAQTTVKAGEERCGCGQYAPDWNPETKGELIEALAHLKKCPHIEVREIEEVVPRIKHTKGDWQCRGCLNTSGPRAAAGL